MVDIVDKALRMGEGHQLKKLENVAKAVNALEDEISALSDEDLKAQTPKFKQEIENGKSLDEIMPEAFATVREVSKRTLGQRHFDVQLMGGAALHWGNIAEMKTGEGKTLVATLPTYLNALEGKGVHVVTVNDYLASYQSELMGRIYRFLGMNVGCIITEQKPPERRKQYNADITYGTNNEFGFDYLRDNMAWEKADLVQRGHHYAIVDEVDSILIDEARTPLIISGPAEGDVTRWYRQFAKLVLKLTRDEDYDVDEKKKVVGILDPGITKVEDFLGIDNLYEPANTALIGYLNNAIKAKELFLRDKDYVVTQGEVLIVDEHTGRILPGRRYNEGLHQAIEAKEGVEIKAENQTFATITLQNYFRMYDKLAGMTGTAETEAAEFMNTYKLGVLPIKTNKPMIRKDQDDLIYRTKKEKLAAIVKDVAKRHAKGQPVLLGTASVESSEVVSALLDVAKIPHQVLNAKQHEKEAAVVAVAGRKGAVTVATNMAGRGTDIMLGGNVEFLADAKLKSEGYSPEDTPEEYEKRWPGTLNEIKAQVKDEHEEVKELGGLYVLGTERHESRRIDNQLRGRSGRQGDPGESRFYLSLEDDLMRLFNTQLVAQVMAKGMEEGQPIEAKSVTKGVRAAQKAVESRNYEIRKNVLKYDDVMNKQRTVIYSERQAVLKGEDIHKDILRFISDTVESYIKGANKGSEKPKDWDWEGLFKALNTVIPTKVDEDEVRKIVGGLKGAKAVEAVRDLIVEDARQQYGEMEETIGETGLRDLERRVVLAVLDRKWREHLYEMDYLKDGIGLRGMGQRDPLVEYQREGYQMYNSMIEAIKEETVQLLFHIDIKQVATTDEAVDEVEEAAESADTIAVASGPDENGESVVEAAEGEVEDTDAKQAIAESAAASGAGESTLPVAGPAPISHAEGKVPVSKRPKSEELKTPWADGRTFPGTGKNAPCPCGSGRKYKMCHGQNEK
ncbi:preprotein translocase subunit SecA [Bifidobacterium longum]|uniref:Protein translocase subunit SecA n=1 Tax=Bifidobacterium longum subsp. longum TaxID=1679 RepID=A0A9Q8QU16_BIFLL|nr:preprotein translocase subunit SecA [Bifidobacterium longum]MBH0363404.1 preprotein translocase subunit SecA [Bifidobacterium longum]MBL3898257.1 preprotein translocase subunit SecA [Bifidobacterium longum subsp. suis]MBM5829556.1 preprotein translocase subunit SecA [Bifidobacterium longum subsp. suillum]QSG87028.1 preprotein translocase subunit SecA [Bifidobacterium longum subsp. suillum]QXT31458.1 preprotein translocase subunit SecA [Bifidobacterium longum subsp. suillum]